MKLTIEMNTKYKCTTKGSSSLLTYILLLYDCLSIKKNEHEFTRSKSHNVKLSINFHQDSECGLVSPKNFSQSIKVIN